MKLVKEFAIFAGVLVPLSLIGLILEDYAHFRSGHFLTGLLAGLILYKRVIK